MKGPALPRPKHATLNEVLAAAARTSHGLVFVDAAERETALPWAPRTPRPSRASPASSRRFTMTDTELIVLFEVRRILSHELDWQGSVEPSHHLMRDLQLDSLGLTVLAVELENRFRIRLSVEDSVGVSTVGDLMRLVASRTVDDSRAACSGGLA